MEAVCELRVLRKAAGELLAAYSPRTFDRPACSAAISDKADMAGETSEEYHQSLCRGNGDSMYIRETHTTYSITKIGELSLKLTNFTTEPQFGQSQPAFLFGKFKFSFTGSYISICTYIFCVFCLIKYP
jgi:hypothetical protein